MHVIRVIKAIKCVGSDLFGLINQLLGGLITLINQSLIVSSFINQSDTFDLSDYPIKCV